MAAVVKFFQDGGFFLYPLVIIFVVGVAISIERWIYLTKETIKNRNLWDDVAPHLGAGNFKQAIALANNSTAQIGTVLKYGADLRGRVVGERNGLLEVAGAEVRRDMEIGRAHG